MADLDGNAEIRRRLAALDVIELVGALLGDRPDDPEGVLKAVLAGVDPAGVCLELATIVVAVSAKTGYPLGQHLAAARRKYRAGEN